MDDNKNVASMLIKFSHTFVVIGVVLSIISVLISGWNFNSVLLVIGLGFVLSSVFLYVITGALTAVFSFEMNLKAVHQEMKKNVNPLWKLK